MNQPKLTYKTCGDNLEKNKREAKSLINSIFNDENSKKKKQHSIKKNIIQIQVKQTNLRRKSYMPSNSIMFLSHRLFFI